MDGQEALPSAEDWYEVRVTIPVDAADSVSAFLWDQGAQGITEEPLAREGDPWVGLYAYLRLAQVDALPASLRDYLASISDIYPGSERGRIRLKPVPIQDWNANWKAHFRPLQVSSRLVICPSWESYVPTANEFVLLLDPGMAFGTGTHETTRGCLKVIDALFGGNDMELVWPCARHRVLDVGTGSGILVMAALLFGAALGVGIDIDPLAVTAAQENAARNGLDARLEISDTPLDQIDAKYDLVLANILAAPLIDMAGLLIDRVEAGGQLVVSGLLNYQQDAVVSAFVVKGGVFKLCHTEGEWTTLLFVAPSR